MDAWRAYDQQKREGELGDFHPSIFLIEVAGHRLHTYGHASWLRRRFDSRLMSEYCDWAKDNSNRRRAELKRAASSTGQPLILHLPTALTVHSILSLLDFDTLMQLRVVSLCFKPLVEQAAVAWLNQRFPSDLQILAGRATKEERRREKAQQVKELRIRRYRQRSDEVEVVSRKRKRPTVTAALDPPSEATAVAAASLPFSSSPGRCPSTTAVSCTVGDAVWVMRELCWIRSLPFSVKMRAFPHG